MTGAGPVFLLQIVHVPDGQTARLPGGGPLEANLVDLIARYIMAKGVSFKTKAHVEKDVRLGIAEAILSLKAETAKIV
jgi:hypothetical protein